MEQKFGVPKDWTDEQSRQQQEPPPLLQQLSAFPPGTHHRDPPSDVTEAQVSVRLEISHPSLDLHHFSILTSHFEIRLPVDEI